MVSKLRDKFFPTNYMISLYRKIHSLRQMEISMKEFREELYRLSIQLGHTHRGEKEIERYMNGLKYVIHDELNLSRFRIVKEGY